MCSNESVVCLSAERENLRERKSVPVAPARKIRWLTQCLDHLYYPLEELIFKHSNNAACLACTFKQSNNIFHLG